MKKRKNRKKLDLLIKKVYEFFEFEE